TNRVVRDADLRRASRLESGATADPRAGEAALSQRGGDGEAGRGMSARTAARNNDHLDLPSERLRRAPALDGRAVMARGRFRRSTVGRSWREAGSGARRAGGEPASRLHGGHSIVVPGIPKTLDGQSEQAAEEA